MEVAIIISVINIKLAILKFSDWNICMAQKSGPKFTQYFSSIISALKHLGGSGRPNEIIEFIVNTQSIDKSEHELLNDGTPRLNKNINWARFYLAKAGLIDGSQRGVWALTERGMQVELTPTESLAIFQDVQKRLTSPENQLVDSETKKATSIADEVSDFRQLLLKRILGLPPSGFERLCQRLLREAGFEKVVVTGRTGDGGIDGQGILRLNHFVSFQVCFQCKRYSGSVGSSTVRDFRGSIMGRADKGIILTTGSYTADAKREATRDGATPIELVDGDQIINMLQELSLGVIAKETITIYEIDENFFHEFQSS